MILDKVKEFLDIEFINRIDEVVMFNNINEKNIEKIIKDKLKKYVDKFNDKTILSTEFVNKIKIDSEYNLFGARRVNKAIEKELKNRIPITK